MTAEVMKVEETPMVDVAVVVEEGKGSEKADLEETHKVVVDEDLKPKTLEKSSSYKEESNFLSDLKEFEKKALTDFRSKLEEAILGNNLFKKEEIEISKEKKEKEEEKEAEKPSEAKVRGDEEVKETVELGQEEDKNAGEETAELNQGEDKNAEEETAEFRESPVSRMGASGGQGEDKNGGEVKIKLDLEISLWGVPLLPSKGHESTDVILLKFLRAREFKTIEAFEMLKKTLQWRKESNIDSIMEEEDLFSDLRSASYMSGIDCEGHPVCYNIFGVFEKEEVYQKTFGTEENRGKFLRWRWQVMEKGIQKLNFKPEGVSSLLQINDLRNSPGPSKKELRIATKQAVGVLQDNYPELVAKNIFINVPFWYYALNALLSPFLTQRTKSKFVVARPARVTETLLKYIPAEEIPVQYGGFKRENDYEFTREDDSVSEFTVKAGSVQTIEIPAPLADSTYIWDLTVLGWEVKYKEEFAPNDEGSYTIIVQKGKKMSCNEPPIRNTFRNNEPGKIILTIENVSNKKKKILYRFKAIKGC